MIRNLFLATIILISTNLQAQVIKRVEPPCWWVGMNNPNLQLLVHGDSIASADVGVLSEHVELKSVTRVENSNYLFLNLNILPTATAGTFDIALRFNKGKPLIISYELKQRIQGSAQREGFSPADVVYLIMPDRFANGDTSNDNVDGMPDVCNRKHEYARHGGDIQGVINNLHYISQLGVTALWLTPVLENNQPQWSYHGYAITDMYKVDARMGSNNLYCQMVEQAHAKGLKVIKDLIFNHFGSKHWLINDLPSPDWLNQWDSFTRTNYRIPASMDIHAAPSESKFMLNGWFDTHMPDLNQANPLVANYLTQASIWWIEYANLDGIRLDTEPYCDHNFITQWNTAVRTEYPNFNVVGETWVNYPAWVAYWQKDANNLNGYNSQTPTVMDFPLMYAIQKAFTEKTGWDTGLARLYEIIAHDFIYKNPSNLLIFADNHDVGRIRRTAKHPADDVKLALAFLLTTRGIPQLYYGTEVGMAGDDSKGHGAIRKDFLGGWATDKRSAFTQKGRSSTEQDIYSYASKLLNWRKTATAVHSGKLTHYIPADDCYVYFRHHEKQTVMVIINSSTSAKTIGTKQFGEMIGSRTSATDVITGERVLIAPSMQVKPRSALIVEFD